MVSSSSAALRLVVPEPGGLGEPLRVTHSLTGGAGPPRPPAGLVNSGGMSNLTSTFDRYGPAVRLLPDSRLWPIAATTFPTITLRH